MKVSVFTVDLYGPRQLISEINENLDSPARQDGVSHVFFGHDDIPAPSLWIHEVAGGRVFPTKLGERWGDSQWTTLQTFTAPFLRQRTSSPPQWAREMAFEDGRNAVVMRCDDVGQSGSMHGFHLVTVDPRQPSGKDVSVEWIQIPR